MLAFIKVRNLIAAVKEGFVEATIAISLRDIEIGDEIKNVIKKI